MEEYCLLAQFAVAFTIQYLANVSKENSSTIEVCRKFKVLIEFVSQRDSGHLDDCQKFS